MLHLLNTIAAGGLLLAVRERSGGDLLGWVGVSAPEEEHGISWVLAYDSLFRSIQPDYNVYVHMILL